LQEREEWVDYAKAFGIILVTYGHVARGVMNAGIKGDESVYYFINNVIYSFHMPLFFFLSGLFFISSLQRRGAYSLFKNKLATIFYPYIVWSILQGSIELLLSNYTNGNVTVTQIASFLWAPRAQFWFLYALFLVSLVGILVYTKLSAKYYWLILVFATIAYINRYELVLIPLTGFVLHNFVFFAFGIVFYQKRELIAKNNYFILPVSFLVFIILQWYFHIQLNLLYTTEKYWLALLVAICSILFVSSLSISLLRFKLRWLAFLGEASLGIYVMHIIAGSGIRIILQKMLGINDILTHLVIGTTMGVLIPLMIMFFLKDYINVLLRAPKMFR
jgi:fucose 4-O-acetylase-like acetyltransferase